MAMLVVLGFLILSYRQTIKAYPSAGGAYIVTRDNFGLLPAQVAGVALLDRLRAHRRGVGGGRHRGADVGVRGAAAVTVPISVGFIVLIAFGNLRGVRESGKLFAVPTYFFIVNMAVLLAVGLVRMAFGDLPVDTLHARGHAAHGFGEQRHPATGAALFVVLHAFASGGAAVTGVEAISNGVPAFRDAGVAQRPADARRHGHRSSASCSSGLSILAANMHVGAVREGHADRHLPGRRARLRRRRRSARCSTTRCRPGTMLILVLAANTSFADFPRLASFHAGDNFMPRQLTKRGHRLVFSNGIIALAVASIVLVIVTGAKVDRLIPLYAIGVFTAFTLSQAGMAKHHLAPQGAGLADAACSSTAPAPCCRSSWT